MHKVPRKHTKGVIAIAARGRSEPGTLFQCQSNKGVQEYEDGWTGQHRVCIRDER